MKIKNGGQLECFGKNGQRVDQIRIHKNEGLARSFELWIVSNDGENGLPGESLSYLTIDELLDLQEEIKGALLSLI
jgi:hypothetical protein